MVRYGRRRLMLMVFESKFHVSQTFVRTFRFHNISIIRLAQLEIGKVFDDRQSYGIISSWNKKKDESRNRLSDGSALRKANT